MKKNLPFEEKFKNQLEQYEPAVPAYIWENIERNRDKKRRAGFWWNFINDARLRWLGAFIILLIGAVVFWNWNKEISTNNDDNKSKSSLYSETNNTSSEASNTKLKNQPNSTPTNDNSNTLITNNSNRSSNTETKKEDAESRFPAIKNEKNLVNSNHTTVNSNVGFEETMRRYKSSKTAGKHKMQVSKTPETSALENAAFVAIDSSNNADNTTLEKQTETAELIKHQLIFQPNIQLMNKKEISIPCPVNNPNPAHNKKYLDVYSSADYVIRQFNDTPNSAYLQMRKQSTRFSSAYSFGLRYTKVFNNGLSIRGGVNYSQINEKFKYAQGNIIQLMYIVNAAGDTIGSYQSTSTRYKTTYNTYRTLDIPVSIGYETAKGRWNINYNAGVIINAHSWNQGEVLDRSLTPVKINANDTQTPYQFKTNIGIGGLAAISFYYNLNEKIKLFGEPYFRYNFSTISKAELTLKQKYHTAGLKLGIRMDLK